MLERETDSSMLCTRKAHQLKALIPRLRSTQEPRLGAAAPADKEWVLLHRGLTDPTDPSRVERSAL